MFLNDEPSPAARQRHVKGYTQIHSLGQPSSLQGPPQMQAPHPRGHPQEYPHHPNYPAMENEPEYDNYDLPNGYDEDEDEMYADADPKATKTVWDNVKDFFKSTAGIVTLVVILAAIIAVLVWYYKSKAGYKFLYY